MNKKIEQLLVLALSSPAAEDMKIRAKLIEDARELDYLTVNDKRVIKMITGLRKEDGIVHNRVNIDDVFLTFSIATISMLETFMPHVDIAGFISADLDSQIKLHDKNRKI